MKKIWIKYRKSNSWNCALVNSSSLTASCACSIYIYISNFQLLKNWYNWFCNGSFISDVKNWRGCKIQTEIQTLIWLIFSKESLRSMISAINNRYAQQVCRKSISRIWLYRDTYIMELVHFSCLKVIYQGKLSPLDLRSNVSAEPEYSVLWTMWMKFVLWTKSMLFQVDQFPLKLESITKSFYKKY